MKPVNENATKEAKELLAYLYETAGKKIITGQHTQTNPMEEITYIHEKTGAYPKLQGFELLSYSPNINYADASEACLTEVKENQGTMDTAIKWAKETDGIVSICFHWFSPVGGRDKSFYSEHTEFDPEQVLVEGTKERKAFYQDLDVIAGQLARFQQENIPVLWRPFHEVEGTWFWWGRKGGKVAAELYKLMFDYYVNQKHLDNLLWVWSCPTKEGYPGDAYVDVVSWDIYLPEYEATDYQKQYEELGRSYYEKHKDEEECEEAEQFFLIKEAVEEIERMKAEVLRIQGSAECPKCGAKMPEGAVYCSNCGTKMDDMYEEE